MRHAQNLALEYEVSIIHVYRLPGLGSSFKTHVEKDGKLTIYRVAYRQHRFKFVASARATLKAMRLAKKDKGSFSRIFLNVFYPLGAHLPWIKKRVNAPIYALEHWTGYHQDIPSYQSSNRHLKVARWASKYCNKVIGVSEDLNRAMVNNGLRNVDGLVYNVVDDELFKPKNNRVKKEFQWLHISSLKDDHKNFSLLLKSFAVALQNTSSTLTVINSGGTEPYMGLIDELGIADRIHFTGKLSISQVAEVMQESNAFVLSSNFENMPCVILEALCSGLPVVSTDVGGIREVIHQENGILVPKANALALTKAMVDLHANRTQYQSEKISEDARRKFGKEAVLQQLRVALDL